MNRTSLVSLAMSVLALPLAAQTPEPLLCRLLEQTESAPAAAPVNERAAAFPALAALPADTDSFLAVGRLGELVSLAGGADAPAGLPVPVVAQALESFALGVSAEAAVDLQRLAPLFELLDRSQSSWVESWMHQAEPGAALAVVAQQRETLASCAGQLVQSTADFRLAPVYMVLTAKPEARMLLHQASMLPLMIPVEPGGPVELTAQGAWRGFCLKGELVDLSDAGLDPEHEARLRANLEKVRVYVMARVVGDKLVLAITSDMAGVKLPAAAEQSLLATDKFNTLDSCLKHRPWAVGYTSPALVNLCRQLDLQGYRSVARFVSGVLRRLGPQQESCARAAVALDALMQSLESLTPSGRHAEQVMVWQEDALYVRTVADASGLEFVPGTLGGLPHAMAQDTVLFASTTPVRTSSALLPPLPVLLDNVATVLQGCRCTLQPQHAEGVEWHLKRLNEARPGLDKLAAGAERLNSALTGCTSLLVQEQAADAAHPVQFSLRSGVADAAALDEAGTLLREGVRLLGGEEVSAAVCLQTERNEHTLVVSNASGGGLGLSSPESGVPGGAVFSLQPAPLGRVLERAAASFPDSGVRGAADAVQAGAALIERIDGAAATRDGRLHTLLRIQSVQD